MEISLEQKYDVDGIIYLVKDIRVTNILSPTDFKVAILFVPLDSDSVAFQA